MNTRRRFLLNLLGLLAGGRIFRLPAAAAAGKADRRILPRGTDPRTLVHERPQDIDTRHLEVMPLKDFKTMGLSDHRVDPGAWRLSVEGAVRTPLYLTCAQVQAFTAVERDVLLICPGVFCNHGRWRGVSIRGLLDAAGADPGVTHVTVHGPSGPYRKTHRLALGAIAGERAFLAYGVNGASLPVRHGFPLRLVSENDYGFDWVKYVDRLEAGIVPGAADEAG